MKNLALYFLHAIKLYRHYIKVNIGDKRFTDKGFQWNYFTEESSIKEKVGKSKNERPGTNFHMLRKHTALSLREIGVMLGMKYRAVSELERYFSNELLEKKPIQKMVASVEKDLRKMAFLG